MRTLPVRLWLLLLIVAVVAVPVLTTVGFFAAIGPRPPSSVLLDDIDPGLHAEIVDHLEQWRDPTWQAGLTDRLANSATTTLLLDPDGAVIYRSPGWQDAASPASSPGPVRTTTLEPPRGGGAVALLRYPLWPPEPPWFNTTFWRIPLSQMAALLLIAAAIALFVNYAFLRPLSRVVDAMRQIGAGDLEARVPRSHVTEVDQVATAFAGMADALRASLERQEALEQERRMTISAVVHDLRTPLFSLRGYLQGLATGLADTPEKAERYVRVCREKADALERLVSDLFAYTRTEYLEEVVHPEPVDLGELLRRTVEGLQPQADAKEVRLWLDTSVGTSLVEGDPLLLTRAVENVLDNAVRHTPTGGEVRVSLQHLDDHLAFTVTDTGPGIAPGDLPHLFTPMYRGESSRNRRTGGAGLGLSIARRLLRAHGGELTAANTPGGGAMFTGILPTHAPAILTDTEPTASAVSAS